MAKKTETIFDKADKIAKKIDHELDPYILSHNIHHNPNDFTHEKILALFIKYGEQCAKK